MKIPSEFQLGFRTWTVKHVGKRKWYGRTYPSECRIELSSLNENAEAELHTFVHELLHAVAVTMGWSKFNDNEMRIDAMAGLLIQAMTTTK